MIIKMPFETWLKELQEGYVGKQSGNDRLSYKWEDGYIKRNYMASDNKEDWEISNIMERTEPEHRKKTYWIVYDDSDVTKKIELIIKGM